MKKMSVEERFFNKIELIPEHTCWEWSGNRNRQGYASLHVCINGNKYWTAHRVSWVIHYGAIPDKLCVCHKCDNPGCVNPHHLFIGTHKDNFDDCIRKGRNPALDKHAKSHEESALLMLAAMKKLNI